jgi:hypothetical protein
MVPVTGLGTPCSTMALLPALWPVASSGLHDTRNPYRWIAHAGRRSWKAEKERPRRSGAVTE